MLLSYNVISDTDFTNHGKNTAKTPQHHLLGDLEYAGKALLLLWSLYMQDTRRTVWVLSADHDEGRAQCIIPLFNQALPIPAWRQEQLTVPVPLLIRD